MPRCHVLSSTPTKFMRNVPKEVEVPNKHVLRQFVTCDGDGVS